MNHWLLKTEPGVFGIDDLARAPGRRTFWDGVRNYQARNTLRDAMKKGDLAFLYHSGCEVPGIAGIVEVVKEGYPDATAFDRKDHHYDPKSDPASPTWYGVDVKLKRRLPAIIALEELKRHRELAGMQLLKRGNRLSVLPVSAAEWAFIVALAGRAGPRSRT